MMAHWIASGTVFSHPCSHRTSGCGGPFGRMPTADESELLPLIFDPQTAGGLLATVPEAEAEGCVDALREAGYPTATVVGQILPQSNHLEPITLLG